MGEASLARIRPLALLGLAVSAIATAPAIAQPRYAWELSGLESSTDYGPSSDFDLSSFGATYYFDRVEDGEGPYALPFKVLADLKSEKSKLARQKR